MPDVFVGSRYTREAWRGAVVPTGQMFSGNSSPEGIERLAECISDLRPRAVLVQAMNRGELPLVVVLLERGVRVMVVTKDRLRTLATGQYPLDAAALAGLAGRVRPLGESLNTREEYDEQVRLLLARLRQVLEMQAQEEERRRVAEYAPLQEDLERHLFFLDRQVGRLHELLLYMVQAVPARLGVEARGEG